MKQITYQRKWLSDRGYPLAVATKEFKGVYQLAFEDSGYDGWYYYNETRTDAYGPYETAEEAVAGEAYYRKPKRFIQEDW